jgi:hypothetical protein
MAGTKKNPHAVALGKRGGKAKMSKLSAEERRAFAKLGGESGGRARAERLSAKERSEIAKRAAEARWKKNQS